MAGSAGMEFSEVVRRRRMIRHYSDKPLAPEVTERILASALRAPSAGFSQGWAFLALTDPADRARFWPFVPTRVEKTPTMQDAPLVVVPLAHKAAYLARYAEPDKGWEDRAEARWPAPYWYIDTGVASLLMLLTAVDEGLGACRSAGSRWGTGPRMLPSRAGGWRSGGGGWGMLFIGGSGGGMPESELPVGRCLRTGSTPGCSELRNSSVPQGVRECAPSLSPDGE
ncbi:nitroreductase family protein [Streptomyces sp. YS-B37]|uniref:nitroreductase family protein n=1 Tax=Streptomyces sp. YS-B37 TaxID=3407669 RepID=UPI003B502A76